MKALVIQSDSAIRRLSSELLGRHGFAATEAETVAGALELARQERFDLAFIERYHESSDALEFCREIRKEPINHEMIVIVSGGGRHLVDPLEVMDAGADDIIQRPLDTAVLETRVLVAKRHIQEMRRRHATEAALEASQEIFRAMVEAAPTCLILVGAEGEIVMASSLAEEMFGFSPSELVGKPIEILLPERFRKQHPLQRSTFLADPRRRLMGEGRDLKALRRDGTEFNVEVGLSPLETGEEIQVVVNVVDITQRKRLEDQVIQSQKMESLGRLAGGLAHDFNNLLAVVLTNCGFLLRRTTEAMPWRRDIEGIRDAAERAAELTRQLLAISRKQVMSPKVLNLNATLGGIEEMLRRLIGEDVDLSIVTEGNLGTVRADPGQIVQVIVNLVVNARDSMPSGGRLTIETANVDLDSEYGRFHPGVEPGPYVRIVVSDTGTGMSEDLQRRIFEPFFTTKEVGKGTGLGLSTALGIVKQSGGHMWVYSEPGSGSSFKIFLPRLRESAHDEATATAVPELHRGSATVLLVEDSEMVRDSARKILESSGYRVLMASGGAGALALAERQEGQIDLLLTDVVMPQMSGRELAEVLSRRIPGLKVLFMSGYTDSNVAHQELLAPGMAFLQKPFTIESLSRKVAEVLETQPEPLKASPTILVVEDKEDLRRGICYYLEDGGYRTIEAGTADEARRHLRRGIAQLVVTDLMLDGPVSENGFQTISREFPEVPVIVISGAIPEENDLAGPGGRRPFASLLKPFEKEELLACVRDALRA